jgi:hypothetical protein
MSSFEEKYRQKQGGGDTPSPSLSPAMTTLHKAAREEYKAFNSVPHPKRKLWVRTNNANAFANVSLPYSLLNHIIYDGNGFVISLHFSAPIICVTIQGRNLGELHHKLLDDEIEWVQEFDARQWETPVDGEPCITGIEVSHAPRLPKKDSDGLAEENKVAAIPSKH